MNGATLRYLVHQAPPHLARAAIAQQLNEIPLEGLEYLEKYLPERIVPPFRPDIPMMELGGMWVILSLGLSALYWNLHALRTMDGSDAPAGAIAALALNIGAVAISWGYLLGAFLALFAEYREHRARRDRYHGYEELLERVRYRKHTLTVYDLSKETP